jgi:hypothetical protein
MESKKLFALLKNHEHFGYNPPIAVSESEEKLSEFCKEKYGYSPTDFTLNCKYYIEPCKIELI